MSKLAGAVLGVIVGGMLLQLPGAVAGLLVGLLAALVFELRQRVQASAWLCIKSRPPHRRPG